MKNNTARFVAALTVNIFLTVILVSVFVSCGSESGGDSGTEDLEGTWLKVWTEEPYQYSDDGYAEALIFDIDGENITAVFYAEAVQVGGFRGTYTAGDGEITVRAIELWNEEWEEVEELPVWNVQETPETYIFPYTLSGSTLYLNGPDETDIDLSKTDFRNHEEPMGIWEYSNSITCRVSLLSEGQYSYLENGGDSGERDETGTWSASGIDSGYLRSIATMSFEEEIYMESLVYYTVISGEILTFSYVYDPGAPFREFEPYSPIAD